MNRESASTGLTPPSKASAPAARGRAPWADAAQKVPKRLEVSPEQGLTEQEATRRRKQHGPNRLREAQRRSALLIFAQQFQSLIVALLGIATGLAFLFGEWLEAVAIAAVILINAAIGFFMELRAVRSMEALHRLGQVHTKVRRDGQSREVPAEQLVPGDIVLVEAGDLVTADLRLVKGSKLQVDESTLTGESAPVAKQLEPVPEETVLAERSNMLFKGTAVTRGSGEGVVVGTGMSTELGRISTLTEEAEEERTPLERRLDQLGHRLLWLTLGVAALVAVSGVVAGKELFLMLETGIALAVAAVPEGLPIVATVALARGMWRMRERNALVNRLSAVETLGATTVICTDKTGTLTENRMTVEQIAAEPGDVEIRSAGPGGAEFIQNGNRMDAGKDAVLGELLRAATLCNNASFTPESENGQRIGDPMEVAVLEAAARAGLSRDELLQSAPEVREEAFDPDVRMMATFHEQEGRYLVAVKGAPEPVLDVCSQILTRNGTSKLEEQDRQAWHQRSQEIADRGYRMLAIAMKTTDSPEAAPYEQLTFLGLTALADPPRSDVASAISVCHDAGIRVVMVTGDQSATARNIAVAVGLIDQQEAGLIDGGELKKPDELSPADRQRVLEASLFSRVSPEQKLDLVAIYQADNQIVAMTGDGVNDAPALKKADIGVAMGQRGTQVACEAADMVLTDDSFPTIVVAVEQGRVIFHNIRNFVLYLLSCNMSEVMTVGLASLAGAPLPILPLQILFLNVVTDVFPALALGLGRGDPRFMKEPPRPASEEVLTGRHWVEIGGYGLGITLAVLAAFFIATFHLSLDGTGAVTVSFLTLAFSQLWHVFNMRERGSGFLRNDIVRNPFVWGAVGLCVALLLAAVYIPVLATVLGVTHPGSTGWVLVITMSLLPYAAGQVHKSLSHSQRR